MVPVRAMPNLKLRAETQLAAAKIEVHSPVPQTFELVSYVDQSHRSCRVVWRKEPMIGVKFL